LRQLVYVGHKLSAAERLRAFVGGLLLGKGGLMWRIRLLAVPVAIAVAVTTGKWWATLIAVILLTAVILILKAGMVVVPERKAVVVFNCLKFYVGVRRPGLGLILPFWHHVGLYLDLGLKVAQLTLHDIHTRDQVPITLSLSLVYRLDPWTIPPEARPQLIDLLELSALPILQRQAEHLARQLVSQRGIAELFQPEVRAFLEDSLTDGLRHQVDRLGIVICDSVMLGHTGLPAALQAEIHLAHQARIHAMARVDALNALRETLDVQPERAWDKVLQVEAVDAMGRNGVPVFYPFVVGWGDGTASGRVNGKG
jgi:regulator of protease activity HflC (stomatin/prohibitin superfamily)